MQFYPSKPAEYSNTLSKHSMDAVKREGSTSERSVSKQHATTVRSFSADRHHSSEKTRSKSSCPISGIPGRTERQSLGASPKTCGQNDQEKTVKLSNSSVKTWNSKQSTAERLPHQQPFSNRTEQSPMSSETLEGKHSHHAKKRTWQESSSRAGSLDSGKVKERRKSSPAQSSHHAGKERQLSVQKSEAPAGDKAASDKVLRFSLDSRLDERSQKPCLKTCGSFEMSMTEKETSKSPSRKTVAFCFEETSREEKSTVRLSPPSSEGHTAESSDEYHCVQTASKQADLSGRSASSVSSPGSQRNKSDEILKTRDHYRSSETQRHSQRPIHGQGKMFTQRDSTATWKASPGAECLKEHSLTRKLGESHHRSSPENDTNASGGDRFCLVKPSTKREEEDECHSNVTEVSDTPQDQRDTAVSGVPSASKYSSPSRRYDSGKSSPSSFHSGGSPHGFRNSSSTACDPQSAQNGGVHSDRHGNGGTSPQDTHGLSRKLEGGSPSSDGSLLKDGDGNSLVESRSSGSSSGKRQDSSSDEHTSTSTEVKVQARKHRSSSDRQSASGSDRHLSKSHSSSHSEKHSSHSDKHSSSRYSDKHSSAPSDKQASKSSDRKRYSSSDRRTSGESSSRKNDHPHSKSHHNRHSGGKLGSQKSVEDGRDQSGTEKTCGSERTMSVSPRQGDEPPSQCSSLRSPLSEEDGRNMEVSFSPDCLTSPDVLSEKENKNSSKRRHSTCVEKHHEKNCTGGDTGDKRSSSKPDGVKDRRPSTSEVHSSSNHKPRRPSAFRKNIEIKPVVLIVNESSGYITSPDITSEEDNDEEGEKNIQKSPASMGSQRRESTNSQDEVGPVSLAKHQLKPILERQGGSYAERLKVIEKLIAVKQKMNASEEGYQRKRAARGEVKKRRARREKLEGDFSGSCREKIEYNVEDKPSLKRPEPKPEEPKPEKPPKKEKARSLKKEKKEREEKTRPKEKRRAQKEEHKSKQNSGGGSKPRSRSHSTEGKRRDRKKENKKRMAEEQHSWKDIFQDSSPVSGGEEADACGSVDVPAPRVQQSDYQRMKSMWSAIFGKSKKSGEETPASSSSAPGPQGMTDGPTAPKKKRTSEDEGGVAAEDMDVDYA